MKATKRIFKYLTFAAIALLIACGVMLMIINMSNNNVKNKDNGASATGTVSEVKKGQTFFLESYELVVDYTAENGKDYTVHLLTESPDVKKGDSFTFNYVKATPEMALTDEMVEIQNKSYGQLLMILGIVLGGLIVIDIILAVIWRAQQKKREEDRRQRETFNSYVDMLAKQFEAGGSSAQSKPSPQTSSSRSPEEKAMEMMDKHPGFWEDFYRSLQLKKECKFTSALRIRLYSMDEVKSDAPYLALAQHNMMALQCFQCCEGEKAYQNGKLSLENEIAYRELSDTIAPALGYNVYDESLVYTAMLAKNRDEARELLQKAVNRGKPQTADHAREMLGMMEKFPKWVDYQKNYAANYYSRVNAQMDKGQYSPACALLGLILSREGQKGYDLAEEEYVSLLDDYLMVSLRYFSTCADILLRNGGLPDEELLFIVRKPLKALLDFLPDCEEKRYKEIFKTDLKEYSVYAPKFDECLPEYGKACKALGMKA